MKTRILVWIIVLGITMLASACAAPVATPPNVTLAQATATMTIAPALPSATPHAPPSNTPPPAISQSTPRDLNANPAEALRAALAKNAQLTTYRAELLVVKDKTASADGTLLYKFAGEIKNQDAHTVIQDSSSRQEFVALNGKLYQRNESVSPNWLTLSDADAKQFKPTEIVIESLNGLIGDPATWQAHARATLEGSECDIYVQDKYATATAFFKTFGGRSEVTPEYIDAQLDQAQAKAWVCQDGYLRQATMTIAYKPAIRPGSIDISLRIFDVNGNIAIAPPALDPQMPQGDATTAVRDAVNKTKTLKSYRFETTAVTDGKQVSHSKGDVQGENQAYTHSQTNANGTDAQEILVFDGKMYKRSSGSQGAWELVPEESRYNFGQAAISQFSQLVGDPNAPSHFNGADIPFAWKGKETLDGVSCDVYVQTQKIQIGAYFEMTVCPDGYWHRGQMTVSMEAGDMSRMLSITGTTRLYDLNAPITIQGP